MDTAEIFKKLEELQQRIRQFEKQRHQDVNNINVMISPEAEKDYSTLKSDSRSPLLLS